MSFGNTAVITGTLTRDYNTVLKNTALDVIFNGKSLKIKTDANGTFKITTKTNKLGTNNITLIFKGNNNYQATNKTTTFKVIQANTTITINNIPNTKKGNNITITGTFKDQNKNPLRKSTLKVTLNNKTFNVKTDDKATFTINTKADKIGTNNITITYAGSNNYKTSTAKTTFTVVKA